MTSLLILVVGMVTILGAMMAWASCVADYEPMENLSGLQAVTDLCTQSSWAAQWRTSVARDRPLHGVDLSVMEALANRQTKHEAIERAHGRIG